MINKIIAVYPGRFQPMGRHHKATYDWMVANFGANNSYIVTSDKVCLPDSPFCFDEKERIASAYGIPSSAIRKERIVYAPTRYSFIQNEDPYRTAVVIVVGEKDLKASYDPKTGSIEKPRFEAGKTLDGIKRDGSPTYFRSYTGKDNLEGFEHHGYVIQAPHQSVDIAGEEMSGSELRRYIPRSNEEEFESAMGFSDPDVADMMRRKLRKETTTFLEHCVYGSEEVEATIKKHFDSAFFKRVQLL